MNKKKNHLLYVVIYSIIYLCYLGILFIIFSNHDSIFYTIVFSSVVLFIATLCMIFITLKSEVGSSPWGYATTKISCIYNIIYYAIGLLVLSLKIENIKLLIIVLLLFIASYIVLALLVNIVKNNEHNPSSRLAQRRTFKANDLITILINIREENTSHNQRQLIDNIIESLKYSDPYGNNTTEQIEGIISEKIQTLKELSHDESLFKNTCSDIERMIKERAILCKGSKRVGVRT